MPLTILIAEDDEDDFFFTARVLRKAIDARLLHVDCGRGAIDYLAGNGAYADRAAHPFPDLMLLDLKMDDLDGHAVLAWIREHLPPPAPQIYVLTGSGEIRDRERVQASGVASGYFVKPLLPQHVSEMMAGRRADSSAPKASPNPTHPA